MEVSLLKKGVNGLTEVVPNYAFDYRRCVNNRLSLNKVISKNFYSVPLVSNKKFPHIKGPLYGE